jgi:hypothetical protein
MVHAAQSFDGTDCRAIARIATDCFWTSPAFCDVWQSAIDRCAAVCQPTHLADALPIATPHDRSELSRR